MKKKKIITFGEILLRLTPTDNFSFEQALTCEKSFGGSEANVAVALANYGLNSVFVSKLPDNIIGQAAVNTLRRYGVDTSYIARGGSRVGMYVLEKGVSPCAGICTYDRADSAMAQAAPKDFNWDRIFDGADLFHFSGITPALSPTLARICLSACKAARKHNVVVSCDVNYRSKLWSSEKAASVMQQLCRHVDLLIINEEEAEILGAGTAENDFVSAFKKQVEILRTKYPCTLIAGAVRANANTAVRAALWTSTEGIQYSQSYPLHVIDPVGAGDAFCAALIYGLLCKANNTNQTSFAELIDFAAAACALKHSIKGDFNLAPVETIKQLMNSSDAAGVQR